jgi:hypothetical protein
MRRALPVGIAALVVAVLLGHSGSPHPPEAPRACSRAVMLDGLLRCDAQAPTDLSSVCGDPRATAPVHAGDAIDRDVVCAHDDPYRGGPGWGRMSSADLRALGQPVDLNEAGLDELRSLPRVGPKIARRIVQGRPYKDVDDVLRVKGIGPKTLDGMRARAIVTNP